MSRSLLVIIFCLSFLNSTGQIEIEGEDIKQYQFHNLFYQRFYNHVDSAFKLDKDFEFEFRLWLDPVSQIQGLQLFILSSYDGKLKARFFKAVNTLEGIKEVPLSDEGIDSLWSNLLFNKILLLPPQDSIKNKMFRYNSDYTSFRKQPIVDGLYMADGVFYQFELFTKEKFRTYSYMNPDIYLKGYPQTEEFYRAYVIVSLVKDFIVNNSN